MKRAWGSLFLLVAFILRLETPASACSPFGWDFAKHFSGSRAVVHGRVTALSNNGAKATLQVLAYAGPGIAPAVIELPRTKVVRGGGNCPDLHLKFKADGEYVVFLGDVPPNLRFADQFRTALLVNEKGDVQDMFNHTRAAPDLLADFASDRGYTVQRPSSHAPHWVSSLRVLAWALVGAGVVLVFGLLLLRRWSTAGA